MSKRKKSYENRMYDTSNTYYDERMMNTHNFNNGAYNFGNFPMNNPNVPNNNFNLNNIFDILNNIDFKNLNNIMSFMTDGFDINKFNMSDYVPENNFKNYDFKNSNNEMLINFLNSLKPILKIEFIDLLDRFIQFYMDEVNSEK